jgi:hypothetical protein
MKKILPFVLFIAGVILIYWAWSGLDSTTPSNARMSAPSLPIETPDNTGNYLGIAGGGLTILFSIITGVQTMILNSHKIANEKRKRKGGKKK